MSAAPGRSFLPLPPMPSLTIFIQVVTGWEYSVACILSTGPATVNVGCDSSIEIIGSRE